MRLKSIAVLGASLVLIPAAPASAGTLTTQNSCKCSLDRVWRHLAIDLTGTAAPVAGRARVGRGPDGRRPGARAAPGVPRRVRGERGHPQARARTRSRQGLGRDRRAGHAAGRAGRHRRDGRADRHHGRRDARTSRRRRSTSRSRCRTPTWTARVGAGRASGRRARGRCRAVPVGPGGRATCTPDAAASSSARQPRGGGLMLNIDCQPGHRRGDEPADAGHRRRVRDASRSIPARRS